MVMMSRGISCSIEPISRTWLWWWWWWRRWWWSWYSGGWGGWEWIAHPRGQVDIAALLPVKHLGDEARLEGHHRHDQQGHREYLGGEMIIWIDLANSSYLIISKKTVLSPTWGRKVYDCALLRYLPSWSCWSSHPIARVSSSTVCKSFHHYLMNALCAQRWEGLRRWTFMNCLTAQFGEQVWISILHSMVHSMVGKAACTTVTVTSGLANDIWALHSGRKEDAYWSSFSF